jgi:hypothetical protein
MGKEMDAQIVFGNLSHSYLQREEFNSRQKVLP